MLSIVFERSLSVVALLLPWVIFVANIKFFHGKRKIISAVASVMLIYAAIILQVQLIDARLEGDLCAFDLNGDGVFSGAEINPAQETAMAALVNDTGRAMAPITGAIFSIVYTAICFIVFYFAPWLWSKCR